MEEISSADKWIMQISGNTPIPAPFNPENHSLLIGSAIGH
jgi:hypothetical protein